MEELEQRKIFAKNLNHYLSFFGKSQKEVADAINVSPQTFNTWCQGKALPRMGKVQLLADYFRIKKSELIDSHQLNNSTKTPDSYFISIPVFTSVSAGNGAFADGNIEDYIDIPLELAKKGEFFGLRVKGDSMEPQIIDGDIVVVRKNPEPKNGQTIIAVVNGDEGFCKRIERYSNALGLISNNPEYRPMMFTPEEVENLPVRILGTVERLIRDFK